jgi:hypothetical protein
MYIQSACASRTGVGAGVCMAGRYTEVAHRVNGRHGPGGGVSLGSRLPDEEGSGRGHSTRVLLAEMATTGMVRQRARAAGAG